MSSIGTQTSDEDEVFIGEEAVEQQSSGQVIQVLPLDSIKDQPFVAIDPNSVEIPEMDMKRLEFFGYQFGTQLGNGSFGKVFRCQYKDPTNNVTEMAAKLILIRENLREVEVLEAYTFVRCELTALSRAAHPHVVYLQNAVTSFKWNRQEDMQTYPYQGYAVMFMELADTTLEAYMKKSQTIEEELCKEFMAQIVTGIGYLHSVGVASRDIKPYNILMFRNQRFRGGYQLKHCDFGIAHIFVPNEPETAQSETLIGTLMYRAPETDESRRNRDDRLYDAQLCDVYSIGVILCQMLCGHNMIRGTQLTSGRIHHGRKLVAVVRQMGCSDECCDLIENMLQYDAVDRYNIDSVLRHPFLPPVVLEEEWMRPRKKSRAARRARLRSRDIDSTIGRIE